MKVKSRWNGGKSLATESALSKWGSFVFARRQSRWCPLEILNDPAHGWWWSTNHQHSGNYSTEKPKKSKEYFSFPDWKRADQKLETITVQVCVVFDWHRKKDFRWINRWLGQSRRSMRRGQYALSIKWFAWLNFKFKQKMAIKCCSFSGVLRSFLSFCTHTHTHTHLFGWWSSVRGWMSNFLPFCCISRVHFFLLVLLIRLTFAVTAYTQAQSKPATTTTTR